MKQIFQPGEEIGPYKVIFIKEEPQKGNKRYLKCKCAECGKSFTGRIDSIKSGRLFRCNECKKKKHNEQFKEVLAKAHSEEVNIKRRKFNPGDIIHDKILFEKELEPYYDTTGHKRRKGLFKNLETNIVYEAPLKTVLNKDNLGLGGRSKGEFLIQILLKEMNINFISEYSFLDCQTLKGNLCRFDFYLPDYNTCIEYNGEQHYKNGFHLSEKDYNEYLQNSKIKEKYCKDNNINLIIIPYWDYSFLSQSFLKEKIGL